MKFGMHGMGSTVDAELAADEAGLGGCKGCKSGPWRGRLVDALRTVNGGWVCMQWEWWGKLPFCSVRERR